MVGSGAWRRVTKVMLDDAHLPSERETPVVDNSTNGAGHEMSGTRRAKQHPWWPAGKSGECTLWSPRLEGGTQMSRVKVGGQQGRCCWSVDSLQLSQSGRAATSMSSAARSFVDAVGGRDQTAARGPSSSRGVRRWTDGCARMVRGGIRVADDVEDGSLQLGCQVSARVRLDQRHSGVVQVGAGDS